MTTDDVVVDVSQDWAVACHVQQRFMQGPAGNTGSVDYSARCRQVRALGGDCYDFLPLPKDRLALAIGDASGKSLPAALMIANVQSSLRTAAYFAGNDPATVLETVNRQVHASCLADRFATLFYGVFDAGTRTLRYANGGHNPPLVVRRDGSVVWLDTAALPLGLFPDSTYQEGRLQLHPGDTVITYTDGVIEVLNQSGEEWGVQGLLKATAAWPTECARNAGDLVRLIFNSMDDFSRGCQTDDATVTVLRVL
jgi:sigma-B regulation protein RsbU (phosphoserine phosphatase)